MGFKFVFKFFVTSILFISVNCFSGDNLSLCDSEKNSDLIACAMNAYEKSDKKLNQNYKIVFGSIDGNKKTILRDGQRSWIKFRDEYCSVFNAGEDELGQESAIDYYTCLFDVTSARVYELKILQGEDDIFDVMIYKLATYYSDKSVDDVKKDIYEVGKGNSNFDYYANKNCDLHFLLYDQPREHCLVRVYFLGKK